MAENRTFLFCVDRKTCVHAELGGSVVVAVQCEKRNTASAAGRLRCVLGMFSSQEVQVLYPT
jgi:hypothetical protein